MELGKEIGVLTFLARDLFLVGVDDAGKPLNLGIQGVLLYLKGVTGSNLRFLPNYFNLILEILFLLLPGQFGVSVLLSFRLLHILDSEIEFLEVTLVLGLHLGDKNSVAVLDVLNLDAVGRLRHLKLFDPDGHLLELFKSRSKDFFCPFKIFLTSEQLHLKFFTRISYLFDDL